MPAASGPSYPLPIRTRRSGNRTSSSSSTTRILPSGIVASPRLNRDFAHGKEQGEARAHTRSVLGGDVSALGLGHPLHDGQAEAGPALPPAEEGVENPPQALPGGARALVLHRTAE